MKEMKICNRCLVNKDPVPQGKAHAGCKITPDTKKADVKDGKVRYHTCKEEECLESFLLCDSPVHMIKNQEKLNRCKEKWKERNIQFSVNLVRIGLNMSRKKKFSKKKPKMFDSNTENEDEVFDANTNDDLEVFDTNTKSGVEVFENALKNEEGNDLKEE